MFSVMISIVLTVFNHEKHLARALDSILNQEVDFSFEILVGDDVSNDESASIVLDYASKHPGIIIPIIRESNLGGSKNFTDLFDRCRGKYITFIDGDDFWIDSKKLQTQFDFLENNTDAFAVSHKVRICDSDGNRIGMVPGASFNKDQITFKDVLVGKRFALTATLMRAIDGEVKATLIDLVEAGPRNTGDLTIALFLLDKSAIPILDNEMSVYCFRSIEGDSNYNSTTSLIDRIGNRVTLVGINERFYAGKYNFASMYFRLTVSATRGLIHSKPQDAIELIALIVKLASLFVKSSLSYGYGKNRSRRQVETNR